MTPTEKLTNLAKKFDLLGISNEVLEDERFPIWSGSSEPWKHHYGKGMLAEHTMEVVELCLSVNDYFDSSKVVNPVSVFLAALFHDAGKMWDYQPKTEDYEEWEGAYHKRHVHHITRSALVWHDASKKHGFIDNDDEILHAILSHHGMRDWGSPVSPNTRLAWLLHLCDSISARMDDVYYQKPVK